MLPSVNRALIWLSRPSCSLAGRSSARRDAVAHVTLSLSPMPDSAPRLARSAGVIGLATMTSRILGLVREQVLAYLLRRRRRHGCVPRRVPRPEPAPRPLRRRRHERRLRADLHELPHPRRPRARLAPGQLRPERADPGHARARRGRLRPRPAPRPARSRRISARCRASSSSRSTWRASSCHS